MTSVNKSGQPAPGGKSVLVEFDEGIAWVTLNRPDKKNAMNPALNSEMNDVLDALELDERCKVLVLTGAGASFSAGMDLKEYFRNTDAMRPIEVHRLRMTAYTWQRRKLMNFMKPTIAMVNGWCFGGAFVPLVSCDLALAAHEAQFGLSEINWGIIPAGNVLKAISVKVPQADALYYAMTGKTFDGKKAAEMRLVNESCPLAELRARTRALAVELMAKNGNAVTSTKHAYLHIRDMSWDDAENYLMAKQAELRFIDKGEGYNKGLTQFLDDKTFRPGLGNYDPDK